MPTTKPAVGGERHATAAMRAGGDRNRARAEQLHQEPESQQDDSRQLDDLNEDPRDEREDASAGRGRNIRP